ncbi:MAG: hypothetical protein F4049_06810 [Gemmatimonadetes bacterium]|nr:hypothetical protein [Gemmatimonadota bacterium]
MTDTNEKICFVIAPIGEPESDTRKRSDQVLQHIIRPAVETCGNKAVPADEIDEPGIITNQIIRHVVYDPLVIADLTGQNANVFYELAIRHAFRRPLVQIIDKVKDIPFDLSAMRTIQVDHQNPDSVEEAKTKIREQIQSLAANPSSLENPISAALSDGFGSNRLDEIMPRAQDYPLSTEAAVERLKRYIDEPQHRIRLSDLIDNTVEQVVEVTSGEAFSVSGPEPTTESLTERVRGYEEACSTLLAMAITGGYWAEEGHYPVWQRALERLGSTPLGGSSNFWPELQRYPATLLLYALGLGAVEAGRLRFLGRMLASTLRRGHREDVSAVEKLPPFLLFSYGPRQMHILEGMDKSHVPLNDWMHKTLRPHAERIIPDANRYTLVFDKLEILVALGYAHHKGNWSEPHRATLGAFRYRYENKDRILQEIRESLSTKRDESLFVTCGIFGETADDCKQGLADLEQFIR